MAMKVRKAMAPARKAPSSDPSIINKIMETYRRYMNGLTKTENGNYYVPACSSKRGKNYKKIGLGKLGIGGTSRQRRVREGKNW